MLENFTGLVRRMRSFPLPCDQNRSRNPLPNYELATTSAASSFARMLLIFVPRLLRADSIDGIVLATRSSRKASADAGESAGSVIVWDVEASAS